MTDMKENTLEEKESDNENGRPGSEISLDSSDSNRKRPSLRGSAKFRRVPSAANSQGSMEDKMLALNALLSDSLLITEFPGRNGEVSRNGKTEDDDTLKDEFGDDLSDDDFEELPEDGRSSRDVDYDTDLDMDYDGIVNNHVKMCIYTLKKIEMVFFLILPVFNLFYYLNIHLMLPSSLAKMRINESDTVKQSKTMSETFNHY